MIFLNIAVLLLEAFVLASAISMDAFVASFAYGSNQIKIPLLSAFVVNVVCAVMFGISLLFGSFIREMLSEEWTRFLCFVILFILGLVKLLDGIIKTVIRSLGRLSHDLKFSLFSVRFVLSLYADPESADYDRSQTISPKEAVSLAVALSLDGIAVGFGSAVGAVNVWAVFLCSIIMNALAVLSGFWIGNKVAKRLPFNISWLSGAVLMAMAFLKLT